ncbi:MAG: hypothetical protein JST16_03455 [Bdellovibrionales bacterium]|nr:hypothetical protein [Bdellovibrionales bacterium]
MKSAVSAVLFGLSLSLSASAFVSKVPDTTLALRAFDDACGDAWCEGPFDYSFDNLACSNGACDLFVTLNDSYEAGHGYRGVCHFPALSAIALVNDQLRLTPAAYTAMDACARDLEAQIFEHH